MNEGGELLIYQTEDGHTRLDVRLDEDTVWLSQQQLSELFQTTRENITMHLGHIFAEGELDPGATRKDFLQVRQEGDRAVRRAIAHYNLDAIISVGYRVKSAVATHFRIWATQRLREYIVKGFAMDDERLKEAGGGGYWQELLERIRDIRSSERVLYRQLLDLYATSVDYDSKSPLTRDYFATVQNKLHFAAHGHTAAELIAQRADASKPFMGLSNFLGEVPRKSETAIAKNYLEEGELKRLNTLVSAYFDAAEFRAQRHEPTYMRDWLAHLDRLISAMDAEVLEGPGTVSRQQAVDQAHREYDKFRAAHTDQPSAIERDYLQQLRAVEKRLEGKPE